MSFNGCCCCQTRYTDTRARTRLDAAGSKFDCGLKVGRAKSVGDVLSQNLAALVEWANGRFMLIHLKAQVHQNIISKIH